MRISDVHQQARHEREIAALERENQYLKEVLAEMADALYSSRHNHDLQPELELLVVKWMRRANAASVRAIAASRVESRRYAE